MIEALTYEWGNPPSQVSIDISQECEVVNYYNEFSTSTPSTLSFELNGHTFIVVHGGGNTPDQLFITPRPGMSTSSDILNAPEYEERQAFLCPLGLS